MKRSFKVVEDGEVYYWYEYVAFDEKGNWTKRYLMNKDGKQREYLQTFEYFS